MKLLKNPKCPHCSSKSQKSGKIATLQGKKQRYRCNECGKTFYTNEHQDVKEFSSKSTERRNEKK